MRTYLDKVGEEMLVGIERSTVVSDDIPDLNLKIPLFYKDVEPAITELGFGLFGLASIDSRLPGLAFLPYAKGSIQERMPISDKVALLFEASAELNLGLGIVLRPNEDIQFLTEIIPTSSSGSTPPSGAFFLIC